MGKQNSFVVTGGAGAIGSRLIRRLLEKDQHGNVIAIDNLSSGYEWLLPLDCERLRLRVADVCEIAESIAAFQPRAVFHLAAFFANQNSVDHPLDDLHTNGVGTLSALMWAAANRASRFVYASAGCSIAGHGIEEPIREDMPVSLQLDTPYQITKALGEFYCNYFNSAVPSVRCRFFNSYGPGEVPGLYRNVIPNFIWNALNHQTLTITGTGDETRDFIYVDDLVDGLIRCSEMDAASGGAFNLGTGIETKIGDLAEWIIAACNSRSRIEHAPRRPWDNSARRQADIGRARSILGFEPAVRVREGLGRTVEWFRENWNNIENAVGAKAMA